MRRRIPKAQNGIDCLCTYECIYLHKKRNALNKSLLLFCLQSIPFNNSNPLSQAGKVGKSDRLQKKVFQYQAIALTNC